MKKKQVIGLIAAMVVFTLTAVTGLTSAAAVRGAFTKTESASGEPADNIALIPITGAIGGTTYDMFGNPTSSYVHGRVLSYIRDMANSDTNKGIFLYVDSPGGSVFESD